MRYSKASQSPAKAGLKLPFRVAQLHALLLGSLAVPALLSLSAPAMAACGGVLGATCVASFTNAETPAGVGSIPGAAFSYLGPGSFALRLTDPLAGQNTIVIQVTDGLEAKATTGGLISAITGNGIEVSSKTGPVVVEVGGGGIKAAEQGIIATSGGAGNVSITGSGNVTAGTKAIVADSGGGNVYINEKGTITGEMGIVATTSGTGGMTVVTGGPVTGTAGPGISTTSNEGLNSITIGGGGVSGNTNGVSAVSFGNTGGISISAGGNISSKTGAGIYSQTNGGLATITIDKGVFVSGATAGLNVASKTGNAKITNNGSITSPTGPAFTSLMLGGVASLTNNGILRATVAAANTRGSMDITNNAMLDGKVTTGLGSTTVIGNIGAWENAAGSNITALSNAGTISLGKAGLTPGLLTISGNATFGENSTTTLRVNPTSYDKIQIGGIASLAGKLNITLKPGVYDMSVVRDIITTGGGSIGEFTKVEATIGYFLPKLTITPTGVQMTLGYGELAPIALTKNQRAAAAAFDAATREAPTGKLGEFMSAIYSQSGTDPLATLSQMNADAPTAASNANLLAGAGFMGAMAARQEAFRAPAPPAPAVQRTDVNWYTGVPAVQEAPRTTRIGVWASGFGTMGTFAADKKTGAVAQSTNLGGGAAGLEFRVGYFNAGLAAGMTRSNFKAGVATGEAQGTHVGGHIGIANGTLYANASIAGSQYTNEYKRETVAPAPFAAETQSGRGRAREMRARVEVGTYSEEPGFHIAPFGGFEVAMLQSAKIGETAGVGGAGLMSLVYNKGTTHSAPVFIGVRIAGHIELGSGAIITPNLSLAWRYDLMPGRTATAALAMAPGSTFKVSGARPDANALQARLAIHGQITRHLAIFASVEGDFAGHSGNYTGRAGAALTW